MTWILGLVGAAATGHLTVAMLSPAAVTWSLRTVRGAMALLLGIALHSLWRFAWVALGLGGGSELRFLAYDLALPILALAALVAMRRTPPNASGNRTIRETGSTALPEHARAKWLPALSMLACGMGLVFAAKLATLQPDGAWDAWAMWNFKARWLALGGTPWSEVLTNPIFATAHPDYPLLLPLSISRLWAMTGGVPGVVPQAFGVCAGALAGGLLVAAAWRLRGPMSASVAGAGLLMLPAFLRASASQLADVPLACCYLATLVALTIGAHGERGRWFALAGLSAGAAMWTKNEGVLFFVCAFVGLLAAAARSGDGRREAGRRIGEFVVAAAPFLVAIFVLRSMAIQSDLIAGQSAAAAWQRITSLDRYGEIVRYGATLVVTMPDVIGAIGLAAYVGLRGLARDLRPAMRVVGTLALTTCGYGALYVVTPYELSWHLTTSADRLFVQLWPSAVFAALLLAADEPDRRLETSLAPVRL